MQRASPRFHRTAVLRAAEFHHALRARDQLDLGRERGFERIRDVAEQRRVTSAGMILGDETGRISLADMVTRPHFVGCLALVLITPARGAFVCGSRVPPVSPVRNRSKVPSFLLTHTPLRGNDHIRAGAGLCLRLAPRQPEQSFL